MKWWKVTWRFVLVAVIVGLALYGIWRALAYYLPYSTRFNDGAVDATTPLGVTGIQGQQANNGGPALASVVLEAVGSTGPVGDTFSAGPSFRIRLLDKNHQPVKLDAPVTVTLSSTSASAQFDSSSAAQVVTGKSELLVHYRDTLAGEATVSAFLSDVAGSSLKLNLAAKPAAGLSDITPPQKNPPSSSETLYAVQVLDQYGNAADSDVAWRLIAADGTATQLGTITSHNGQARLVWRPQASQIGQKYTLEASLNTVKRTLIITPTGA